MTMLRRSLRPRSLCRALLPVAAVLAATPSLLVASETGHRVDEALTRLNVLFVIVDDLNIALGCYGHPLVKSPHIDRLAARGVRFDRAYCQAPVCNPTRASCFSGLRPESIGVLDNPTPWPARLDDLEYMPQYFRQHGYYTATIGKVLDHTHVPHQPYWDLQIPEQDKHPPAGQIARRGELPTKRTRYWAVLGVGDAATADGQVARRAAHTLEERAREDGPFFLAVGFRRPHGPYAAPERYFELYLPEKVVLPDVPAEHLKTILPAAKNGEPFQPEKALPSLRAYYACISFMDAQVGVLLEALDRLALWEETVVVFVSDHGYHTGEHGMWHKRTLFEQSARVPLIIVAPGKRAVVCARVVGMVDLYPTLTDLCGLPTPDALEGNSLVPLLDAPDRTWREPALTVLGRLDAAGKRTLVGRTVRTERYRYTEWEDGHQGVELYDHDKDPDEFVNLASDRAHAPTRARMQQLLRGLAGR